MNARDRKLFELAEIAHGLCGGMACFDDRADEMGPGITARGNGQGGKGGHSDPTSAAAERPATVVTSQLDRLIDKAHAAVVDLEAEYGRIARTQRGLPAKGEPSCAWCDAAVQAAAKVAAKSKDRKPPVPLDHRSPTYLFAEVRRNGQVVGRQLTCEWCYRFNLRHGRRPTTEELWVHIQGGRMPKEPKRTPEVLAGYAARKVAECAR